ncbi:MAG: exosortase [Deltaproteobacteria bacterium]|nr:exosortase [Deltaproteobacteria bacterium]
MFKQHYSDKYALRIVLPLLVVASFVLAYYPVWQGLVSFWSLSEDYSHGFFIVPIAGYILWRKRSRLAALPQRTSMVGFFLLFCSLVVYALSYYAEVKTIASLSIITTLAGCVLFLYGPAILKEVAFPLCFMLFMIPLPGQIYSSITIPLQLIVSKASVGLLSAAGVPVLRDGNVMHLPDHTFEVVQACSGLRSLVTLLTLSTIVAFLALKSNILRAVLIICAVPTAVLVNIIRVTLMILVYHFWGYDLLEGTVHSISGLFIFLLAIAIIFLTMGALLRWDKLSR